MSITDGTFPGVRIIDMPDLGAVSDTSIIVGDRAGSGTFTAPHGCVDYVAAGLADGGGTTLPTFGSVTDGSLIVR